MSMMVPGTPKPEGGARWCGIEPWGAITLPLDGNSAGAHPIARGIARTPRGDVWIAREQQDVVLPLINYTRHAWFGDNGILVAASLRSHMVSYAGSLSVLAHLMHFPCRKF